MTSDSNNKDIRIGGAGFTSHLSNFKGSVAEALDCDIVAGERAAEDFLNRD